MEYTREQFEVLSKTFEKKAEKNKLNAEKRKADALNKASQIADLLKKEFGVKNVYLFGSLAWRDKFTVHSDIDIYLADFPAKYSYWDALVRAENIADPYPLNLILAENASMSLKLKVEKRGIIL